LRGDATECAILLGVRLANNPKGFAGRLVIHELGLEPPRAGNILGRCLSVSMKARISNLLAELELA